jgi:hypothetical protein
LTEGAQHLADRGVLAADTGDVAKAYFIQGENVRSHHNRPVGYVGLIVHDFAAWDTAMLDQVAEQ